VRAEIVSGGVWRPQRGPRGVRKRMGCSGPRNGPHRLPHASDGCVPLWLWTV